MYLFCLHRQRFFKDMKVDCLGNGGEKLYGSGFGSRVSHVSFLTLGCFGLSFPI